MRNRMQDAPRQRPPPHPRAPGRARATRAQPNTQAPESAPSVVLPRGAVAAQSSAARPAEARRKGRSVSACARPLPAEALGMAKQAPNMAQQWRPRPRVRWAWFRV